MKVQVITNVRDGEIIFEWLSKFSYDKYEQNKLINDLAVKYSLSGYEIRLIIKQLGD